MKASQTDRYANEVSGGKIYKNNLTSQTFIVDQNNSERVVLWDPMGITYAAYSPADFKHLLSKGVLTKARYLLNMVYTSEGIHGNHRIFIGSADLNELNHSLSKITGIGDPHKRCYIAYSLMDVKSKTYLIPHIQTTDRHSKVMDKLNTYINNIINSRKKWFIPSSISIKELFKKIGAGITVTQENGRSKKL